MRTVCGMNNDRDWLDDLIGGVESPVPGLTPYQADRVGRAVALMIVLSLPAGMIIGFAVGWLVFA